MYLFAEEEGGTEYYLYPTKVEVFEQTQRLKRVKNFRVIIKNFIWDQKQLFKWHKKGK